MTSQSRKKFHIGMKFAQVNSFLWQQMWSFENNSELKFKAKSYSGMVLKKFVHSILSKKAVWAFQTL